MKNKGFTLIELLAVIVILAIIALIATPIILGIINDAREQAKKRSAELVYTGVEYAYTEALYKGADGATITDPTLETISENINIENVQKDNVTLDTDKTTLTIKTSDGVICTVTGNNAEGFKIKCGDGTEGNEAKYLSEKTIATTAKTSE